MPKRNKDGTPHRNPTDNAVIASGGVVKFEETNIDYCPSKKKWLLNGSYPGKKNQGSLSSLSQQLRKIINDKDGFNKNTYRLGLLLQNNGYVFHTPFIEEYNLQLDIYNDIEKIKNDNNLSETEKESFVKSRIGQGEFRKNVIETWGLGEVCPVTKVNIREMIIASHIKPWKNCQTKEERLDGANGIMLCSHLDKLFDNHLISFEKVRGQYILSINENLDSSQLEEVGLPKKLVLNTANFNDQDEKRLDNYLHGHYSIFIQKNG